MIQLAQSRPRGRATELNPQEMQEALAMLDIAQEAGLSAQEIVNALGYKFGNAVLPNIRRRLRDSRGGLSRSGFDALKRLAGPVGASGPPPLEPRPNPARRAPDRTRGPQNILDAFRINAETLRSLERRMGEQCDAFGNKLTRDGIRGMIVRVSALADEFEEIANH
jgi:hypothetical protein